MPDVVNWVDLYNASIPAWHKVPDHPAVVQDFRDRGWETTEDIAARAGAEAEELRGKALDEALEGAGLSKSGTADEKRDRLADHEAKSAIDTIAEEED